VSGNWELWRARAGWDGQIWLKKSAGMGFFWAPPANTKFPKFQ
jgi:hypothetical protein